MRSFEIINESSIFAVSVNLKEFSFKAFWGTPSSNTLFSFSTSHNFYGIPIGKNKSQNKVLHSLQLPKFNNSPCLCIKPNGLASILNPQDSFFNFDNYEFVTQSGPIILKHRNILNTSTEASVVLGVATSPLGRLLVAKTDKGSEYLAQFFKSKKYVNAMLLNPNQPILNDHSKSIQRVHFGMEIAKRN